MNNYTFNLGRLLEEGGCYSYTMSTVCKLTRMSSYIVRMISIQRGYNVFIHRGVEYVGNAQGKKDYYLDKLVGQNPFYQTS